MSLPEQKYLQKQAALIERTGRALGIAEEEATALLRTPRQQSLRRNTLIEPLASMDESLQHHLTSVSWCPEGFFVTNRGETAVKGNPAIERGAWYIQNAASWLPVLALDPHSGETILDMCAAPGGKTSHIAQRAANQAFITANDNSRPRLHKLQANLQRLGAQNTTFTLHDATRLATHLEPASFDKILLDAPCSGEGMMALDNKKDFESWSVAHIKRLQQLQKKLIVQAWKLLKPDGTLVYSTCTMAPEENEAVIDYLLRHNESAQLESLETFRSELSNAVPSVLMWNGKNFDPRVKQALRLAPSPQVEAFFVAKLTKGADDLSL